MIVNPSASLEQRTLLICENSPSPEERENLIKNEGISLIAPDEFQLIFHSDRKVEGGFTGSSEWVNRYTPFFLNIAVAPLPTSVGFMVTDAIQALNLRYFM
jgi:hypothetical protein